MGRLCVFAVLIAGGCNQVFGLDDTLLRQHLSCEDGANSHDEDMDTIANGIDTCPGIYNIGQTDSDGDSIGDACDPREGAMDTIVDATFFETGLGCWSPDTTLNWPRANGSVTTTTATNAMMVQTPNAQRPTIELQLTVLDYLRGSTTANELLIKLDYPNATAWCLVNALDSGNGYLNLMDGFGMGENGVANYATGTHRVRFGRDESSAFCEVDGTRVMAMGSATPGKVSATVSVRGLAARFDYILIYDTMP